MRSKGWRRESKRHSLAARGVKTARVSRQEPKMSAFDRKQAEAEFLTYASEERLQDDDIRHLADKYGIPYARAKELANRKIVIDFSDGNTDPRRFEEVFDSISGTKSGVFDYKEASAAKRFFMRNTAKGMIVFDVGKGTDTFALFAVDPKKFKANKYYKVKNANALRVKKSEIEEAVEQMSDEEW